jgi:transketolase C-terminal domain/subunit
LLERAFEQIKLDVDQQNVNVKLVGYADYPEQGPTHSLLHETALSNLLLNTRSYYPKNSQETRDAVMESYISQKPTFISLKEDKLFGKW